MEELEIAAKDIPQLVPTCRIDDKCHIEKLISNQTIIKNKL